MEVRFLVDTMLGRLAKWLRIMGYDAHYRNFYGAQVMEQLLGEGRKLLSRHLQTIEEYPHALHIRSDHVRDQLREVEEAGDLRHDRSKWFSRCLTCNWPLQKAQGTDARENVPEYVFFENAESIRFCPSCRRYYWPGSHRANMTHQLTEWGF
jgi:uncharacterized protein with PIN domain